MSSVYEDLGETYENTVGSIIQYESVIEDPETGQNMNITDTSVFATVTVIIYKPNGNLICVPITGTYLDRPNSIVEWQNPAFTNAVAGNWKGVIQLFNNAGTMITQQFFNFNINRVR